MGGQGDGECLGGVWKGKKKHGWNIYNKNIIKKS